MVGGLGRRLPSGIRAQGHIGFRTGGVGDDAIGQCVVPALREILTHTGLPCRLHRIECGGGAGSVKSASIVCMLMPL